MIAYVFWHAPHGDVSTDDYERGLERFHRSLEEGPPEGFRHSESLRFATLPWMDEGVVYEDWYYVRDFAALGVLNDAAAAGRHAAVHDRVAGHSASGTGSVYALVGARFGHPLPYVYWLDRPADMKTVVFLRELEGLVEEKGAVLWRRQLSLGPATEYCIHSPVSLELSYAELTVAPDGVVWAGDIKPSE